MKQNGIDPQRFEKLIGITAVAWELDGEAAELCQEHFTSGGRVTASVMAWSRASRSKSGAGQREPKTTLRLP